MCITSVIHVFELHVAYTHPEICLGVSHTLSGSTEEEEDTERCFIRCLILLSGCSPAEICIL